MKFLLSSRANASGSKCHGFESRLVLAYFLLQYFYTSHSWSAVTQVPQGGASLLLIHKAFLVVLPGLKQALGLNYADNNSCLRICSSNLLLVGTSSIKFAGIKLSLAALLGSSSYLN